MKAIYLFTIFFFSLFAGQEKIKFNMPDYEDVIMTSNTYNLPFNVNFTSSTYPKNLKRLEQKSNGEYLNILEYDKNGNLIYKYYRQYVSENWSGKYLTIIERNLYNDKNQPVKTLMLHSNTGASSNEYHYDAVGNIILVNSTGIPITGDTENAWRYIENLLKAEDFDKDKNILKLNNKKNKSSYVFEYDFNKKLVKAFSKEQPSNHDFHVVYQFNDSNQLMSKTVLDQGKIYYDNSYFIEYKDNKKIAKEYDEEKNLKQTTTEYPENKFTIIETVNTEYQFDQKRKYFGKTLIFDDSFTQNNNEKTFEKYDLDGYNIPVKMTLEKNGKIDSTVIFTNKYEFY
ncbi:hypothetical protein [Chryseobacterium sp.]|uniref:hypothetical protein n=1 Tax=Chryseobacterium sp. TaxID=1871047 RepID=UPI000EBFE918|nr:hypothetical protein [Chryseobacterium sp.]HCM35373.1 hypothetical protein [Chryseobacterium sp.]